MIHLVSLSIFRLYHHVYGASLCSALLKALLVLNIVHFRMWLEIKSCRLRCNHYRSKFGYFILVAGNSNELFSRLCCTVECPLLVSPFFSTCVCQDVWLATSSNITAYTLRTKEETDGKFFVKFALLFISRRHVLPFLNDVTCYFVSLFSLKRRHALLSSWVTLLTKDRSGACLTDL